MKRRVNAPPIQRPRLALLIRLGAALTLSIMLMLVKLASDSGVHLAEILFWRQLPTVPILLIWFAARGQMDMLKTRRPAKHALRALLGLTGMALNFGAVTFLPLAEATTFGFTSTLWAVALSALILHEKVGIVRWGAVIAGFAGIVVIAQPGSGPVSPIGATLALAAAFTIALISIQIRELAQSERALTIVFYFAAFSLPILALAMPFTMSQHSPYQWGLLAALALFGLLGQFLLTAALRFGAVASVMVMDYSSLLWAGLLGWWVFSAVPATSLWLGAPLVIGAGVLIAFREHYLSQQRDGA